MLTVGIVGLPNVGKSTVFNALCQGGAKVSNYAFCTIEPNRAVVSVPDPRLERLAEIFQQERVVPAAIEFVDIAGLVRGANKGEGLGNQFLAEIREVDAILHVVRCFADAQVAHVEGDLEPVRDVEIVELELVLADLETVQRRLQKIASAVKGRDRDAQREAEALALLADHLDQGNPARTAANADEIAEVVHLGLLTDKPHLYLANAGEEDADSAQAVSRLQQWAAAPVVALAGKLEADLSELPDDERAAFVAELGISVSGLERVIRACYELLDLVTFFTGVGAEARAWAVPRGTEAAAAAGRIHTDMERGFIRAEAIDFDELSRLGSWQDAHRAGRIRSEGRDYCVQEGDVLLIRFKV
jgi:GTP-binding protein YchF